MKVIGTTTQEVEIDPRIVIQKLIDEKIGQGNWVDAINGVYYRFHEQSAGTHSFNVKEEIDKETYDYVNALYFISHRLSKDFNEKLNYKVNLGSK